MSVYDDARQTAEALYGEADENLTLLCRAAADAYTARLRSGVTAEDCGQTLAVAAALTAVAILRRGNAVSDFSLAAVSVHFADNGDGFPEAAERLMAPYIEPSGFAFRSVKT